MRNPLAADNSRGITLVEVMVAVLILSIGTLAAFRAYDAARFQIGGASERLFAQQVALNRAAEYKALGLDEAAALPDQVMLGGQNWRLEVIRTQTAAGYVELRIQAQSDGGVGAIAVTFLDPDAEGQT